MSIVCRHYRLCILTVPMLSWFYTLGFGIFVSFSWISFWPLTVNLDYGFWRFFNSKPEAHGASHFSKVSCVRVIKIPYTENVIAISSTILEMWKSYVSVTNFPLIHTIVQKLDLSSLIYRRWKGKTWKNILCPASFYFKILDCTLE